MTVPSLCEVRKEGLKQGVSEDDSDEEECGFNALRTDRLKKVVISGQGRGLKLKKEVDLSFHVKTNRAKSREGMIISDGKAEQISDWDRGLKSGEQLLIIINKMMHGRKKIQREELTEEQKQEKRNKLDKIK